jgi:hypothetical protein
MRCPSCNDEYEDHVRTCAACGVPLVPDGEVADHDPVAPAAADARLGTFHPVVAAHVLALLDRRGLAHEERTEDGRVTVLVDRAWRDDVRSELAMSWGDLVRGLPEDEVTTVLAAGGPNPGWYDAPRGGHVDRQGRLVVGVDDDEEAEEDAARVVGPAMLTLGALLVVVGWYVLDSSAVSLAGAALVVLGLFTPR